MYSLYVSDYDGSDPVYLEVDPILPPAPIIEKPIKTYTSTLAFYYNGTKRPLYTHIIDPGVPRNSGTMYVNFQHLSLNSFLLLRNKFASEPPSLCQVYDYRTNTLYTGAILRNLKSDYVEGVKCTDNILGTEQRVVNGTFEIFTGTPS